MQCASPCSTSGGWSISPTLDGDVPSSQSSWVRSCNPHLSSRSWRHYYHGLPLVHSHSVSRATIKAICNFSGLAAATVVVTFAPTSAAARSSQVLVEERTANDLIPERELIAAGPVAEWRNETWDDEEVRAIVVDSLESSGLSRNLSLIAVQNAPTFISHLLLLLKSCYPARFRSGKELTRSEIRCVVLPYLASVDATQRKDIGAFSSGPDLASFVPPPGATSRILSEYPLLREQLKDGQLPPSLSYCLCIGLKPAQVVAALKKFPPIVGYNVEGKIAKVVDFILSLDVSSSLIPAIVLKRPQLFGCNVEGNLRPSVQYLEDLGVERTKWGRILVAFPHMLTCSSAKSNLVFNFLLDSGVSHSAAGKVLSRFPHAVGYSVELKLKPLAAYFRSLGIDDFGRVITRSPQTLGLSLEYNIKPTVEFFRSSLGLTVEEITLIVNRFPQILGLNIEHNLQPKWKFFLGMNRRKTELVDFPQYFGYSLENRILPRYKIIEEKQIRWTLNRMLSTTQEAFFRLTNSYF